MPERKWPWGRTWCKCGHHRSQHGPFRNSATAFCGVQTCRCNDFSSATGLNSGPVPAGVDPEEGSDD